MTAPVYVAGLDAIKPVASLNTPTPKKKKKVRN